MGKKAYPIYKIVAADARSPRDGKFIEAVGNYNPNHDPAEVIFKEDRVQYWLDNGAKPTDTVKSLLSNQGLMLKIHLKRKKVDETKAAEEMNKFEAYKPTKLENAKKRKVRRKESKSKRDAEAKATKA